MMKRKLVLAASLLAAAITHAEVAVIVNPASPAASPSAADAANIFLGKSGSLADGTKVTAVDQEEGSAVRDEFYTKVAQKNASQLKAYWSQVIFTGKGKPPAAVADSAEVKAKVASTADAIGYVDAASVDGTVKVLLKVP